MIILLISNSSFNNNDYHVIMVTIYIILEKYYNVKQFLGFCEKLSYES